MRTHKEINTSSSAFVPRRICAIATQVVSPGMVAIALLITSIHLFGCQSGGGNDAERTQEGREVFGDLSGSSSSGVARPDGTRVPAGWAIVLASFSGPNHQQTAMQSLARIRELIARPDLNVRVEQRLRSGSAIVAGAYPDYDDPRAQKDLDAIHAIEVDGRRPFGGAFLRPGPEVAQPGSMPDLNLGNARQLFGSRAKYTLQIGVYESKDKQEAMQAAEKAALVLRQEGEQAFYYHGPNRSIVTVGVFDDSAFDDRLREVNPELARLRQEFPLNYLNGQFPIIERSGGVERKQPSMLVRIP